MIKMLPFLLLGCYTHSAVDIEQPSLAEGDLYACERPPEPEKKDLKRFEKHALKFRPHVVETKSMTITIPVHDKEYNVDVNFHMSQQTVPEDINHLIWASSKILEKVAPSTLQKVNHAWQFNIDTCFNNVKKIELYHTKCETMNDGLTQKFLDEEYAVKGSNVIAGLTQNDQSTRTFTVSYCYDELLRRSDKISYEDDRHYREVILAHEMTHVWLESCDPGAQFFYSKEFELAAWEFHKSYEPTAKKMHIDYR